MPGSRGSDTMLFGNRSSKNSVLLYTVKKKVAEELARYLTFNLTATESEPFKLDIGNLVPE